VKFPQTRKGFKNRNQRHVEAAMGATEQSFSALEAVADDEWKYRYMQAKSIISYIVTPDLKRKEKFSYTRHRHRTAALLNFLECFVFPFNIYIAAVVRRRIFISLLFLWLIVVIIIMVIWLSMEYQGKPMKPGFQVSLAIAIYPCILYLDIRCLCFVNIYIYIYI